MAANDNLDLILRRHQEIAARLAEGVAGAQYSALSREFSELEPVVAAIKAFEANDKERADLTALLKEPDLDSDMRAMAGAELAAAEAEAEAMSKAIRIALLPKDAADEGGAILEVRAGTGGDEAALFAGDLFRMYAKYVERKRWKVEILSMSEGTAGGFKEIVAEISGRGVFARLKFESGVHRVQRVPATETQGRIHTSAATVAVLPIAEEADLVINEADLKVDTYRSSGAGGQHVNKTEFGDSHYPSTDRGGGRDAGGAFPASQPHQGDGPLALAHPGRQKPEARRRAGAGTALPGRLRRPIAAHPDLQFPSGAGDRPSHQSDALFARSHHGRRRPRRDHRRADCRAPSGAFGRTGAVVTPVPRLPPSAPGMRIGLLGGSFNPPHEGHALITRLALRRLQLDRVWWLVTPGNPLKSQGELAALQKRVEAARRLVAGSRVVVSDIEARIGSRYTYETLAWIKRRAPRVHFVWIMGADNLRQFHRWRHWRAIADLVPIVVVDRPGSTLSATSGRAGAALAPWRAPERDAARFAAMRPPALLFLHGRRSSLSSTALRRTGGDAEDGS